MAGRKNGNALREISLKGEERVSVYDNRGEEYKTTLPELQSFILSGIDTQSTSDKIQGHYSLLSPFYFGGVATEKVIPEEDVDTWCDVEMTVDLTGLFDYRPEDMILAQPTGHEGTGAINSPFIFKIEGLTQSSFASVRSSMSFLPDDDEGQLETRLLFNRHSGSSPSEDFSIEEVSLSMQNGADVEYSVEPTLSFFVGDTIDTNGANDAGKFKFQIKTTVPGVVSMKGISFYINK